ncbi:MAG: GTP-binding protein [Candidatus Lokiarchaeota archaeon]|nr:GTP-binding protein [Candidatus Lokiarchaeota archaeon]
MSYEKTFKLVIAGDGGVGKTSLTNKFITGVFTDSTKITIGVEFFVKDIKVETLGNVRLQIWDFGGEERFRFLLPTYVKGANGVLFLFSLTDMVTLAHLDDWMSILKAYDPHLPIMLVGAKSDLKHLRKVQTHEAIDIAKSRGCKGYVEVSAKTGENVHSTFETISKLMWKHLQKQQG